MMIGLGGTLGSGKTIMQVILLKACHDEDKMQIKTNFYTTFSERINPNELLEFELNNCVLGLDEIYTFVEPRINTEANRLATYFFLQSRKRDVHIIYTAQIIGSLVDLRLRYITDHFFMCTKEVIGENPNTDFVLKYLNTDTNDTITLTYKDVEPYFNVYNTTEIVMPPQYSGIIDINEVIRTFNNSPTKQAFIALMRRDNLSLKYETIKAIYDLLNDNKVEEVKKLLRIKD